MLWYRWIIFVWGKNISKHFCSFIPVSVLSKVIHIMKCILCFWAHRDDVCITVPTGGPVSSHCCEKLWKVLSSIFPEKQPSVYQPWHITWFPVAGSRHSVKQEPQLRTWQTAFGSTWQRAWWQRSGQLIGAEPRGQPLNQWSLKQNLQTVFWGNVVICWNAKKQFRKDLTN